MAEKEEESKEVVKSGAGRTTIDDRKRTGSFSERAAKGAKGIERKRCPKCGHHKAISVYYSGKLRCSRCHYDHNEDKGKKKKKQ